LGRRLTAAWNAEAPGKSSLERKASVSGAPTMISRLPRRRPPLSSGQTRPAPLMPLLSPPPPPYRSPYASPYRTPPGLCTVPPPPPQPEREREREPRRAQCSGSCHSGRGFRLAPARRARVACPGHAGAGATSPSRRGACSSPAREEGSECTVGTRVGATVGKGGGGRPDRERDQLGHHRPHEVRLQRPAPSAR